MEDEEEKKIRHTISAEETFTLAKDVFDIRTFIKNAYANRAVIARRVNIVTLSVSMLFTLCYMAFMLYRSLGNTVSFAAELTVYIMAGAYFVMAALLVIFFVLSMRATTKSLKKFSVALKIIRIIVTLLSVAVSVSAIAVAASGEGGAVDLALDVIVIIFSVLTIIVQLVPMFFGGLAKFVRWLLSPVKIKYRFNTVVLEWYNLIIKGQPAKGAQERVAKKHYEHIGSLIDNTLIPTLGKKYITAIKPAMLIMLDDSCAAEDGPVLEGILKDVFAYAAECGYIVFDPCRDLHFEGNIDEKHKKSVKELILELGTKIGKKALDKYIVSSAPTDESDG